MDGSKWEWQWWMNTWKSGPHGKDEWNRAEVEGGGRVEVGGGSGGAAEWEVPPPPRVVEVPFLGSASVRRRPGSGGVPGFPFFARAYTVTC